MCYTADRRIKPEQESLLRGALPELGARHYTTFPLWHALFHRSLCLKLDDTRSKYHTIF